MLVIDTYRWSSLFALDGCRSITSVSAGPRESLKFYQEINEQSEDQAQDIQFVADGGGFQVVIIVRQM